MGLDTTHNCWHGPYSSFGRFRDVIAIAAKEHYGYEPDYERWPFRAFQGWWDTDWQGELVEQGHLEHNRPKHDERWLAVSYSDPLDVLFIHSDCDGYIFPGHGRALADRLEPLVGYLDDGVSFGPSDRAKLRQFIDGLREAWDMDEVVRFH